MSIHIDVVTPYSQEAFGIRKQDPLGKLEEMINRDLARNFPGFGLKLEKLIAKDNPFLPQTKGEAIIKYICGTEIRNFCIKNKIHISHGAYGMLPLVLLSPNYYEHIELVGRATALKGCRQLRESEDGKGLGVIKFDEEVEGNWISNFDKYKRSPFLEVNSFDRIRDNISAYAETISSDKEMEEVAYDFERELGKLKQPINRISYFSKQIREEFSKDFPTSRFLPQNSKKKLCFLREWGKKKLLEGKLKPLSFDQPLLELLDKLFSEELYSYL